MIDWDDDDTGAPEVVDLGTRVVRARIEHGCEHCGQPILPGQAYVRQAARVDGEVVVVKSHTAVGACVDGFGEAEYDAIVREERDTRAGSA